MSDRLTEIAARAAALNSNSLPGGTWIASPRDELSVLPPETAHVVEDVLRTEKGAILRSSVGTFGHEAHATFTAHAREDVQWLLAEVERLRTVVAALAEGTETLHARVAELEPDSSMLAALYAAGVDNWEGYDEACEGR